MGGRTRHHPQWRETLTPLFRLFWRFRRGMTLGARGVARDAAGRVMLVRHSYVKGWHLPGGGVERDETAEEAMRKEFEEEAGIDAFGPLRLFGVYLNPAFRGDHILLFEASAWRACAPKQSGEILERGFFSLDALPAGTTEATRRRLAEVIGDKAKDSRW